ncbi:MAG TPA: hypothetical protein VMD91_01015 [Candidatus Sulfotelmatobacter sp.]|nr:hypothetical protein [Candidatus Sulfotelmatobacter sp.]
MFALAAFLAAAPAAVRTDTPFDAVQAWYDLLGRGAGAGAMRAGGGTIGAGEAPFARAYELLSSARRASESRARFVASFDDVAHVDLLQAVEQSGTVTRAQVFVEERRYALRGGVQTLAWYAGTIVLVHETAGWRIGAVQLAPENIFNGLFGKHGRASDPLAVAVTEVRPRICGRDAGCTRRFDESGFSVIVRPGPHGSTSLVRYRGARGGYDVQLVRLYDGDYRVVRVLKA